MNRKFNRLAALALASLAVLGAGTARADTVYQTVNDGLTPGPYLWAGGDTIGWYWTPATNVSLAGIETQLRTGFFNINNNTTFTTTLFTDRPAVGGTVLGSSSWSGIAYNSDGWLGGSFSSPLSLTGGTTYFIGFAGWAAVRVPGDPGAGGGVNWIDPPNQPGGQNLGAGSGYFGANYEIQMNTSSTPANIDSPVLRFIAADAAAVPEPSSLVLLGTCLASVAGFGWIKRRKELPASS